MCTVSTSGRNRAQRKARPALPAPESEPEILEGLARDIVSRLSTTLFGEGDVPVWERAGDRSEETEPFRPACGPEGGSDGDVRMGLGAPPELPPERTPSLLRGASGAGSDRPALLVRGTVRSGRQVRHNGDIVVLGDVNPGAQVVAARDILVIGTLRGMAHAGATGDHGAVVAAFRLLPTQLRIASYLARPPEEPGGNPEYPEMAFVRDGVVVVRPLTTAMVNRPGAGDAEPDPA